MKTPDGRAAEAIAITPELCDHSEPSCERVAHGYLADAPAGTRQMLCTGCGTVLAEEAADIRLADTGPNASVLDVSGISARRVARP